MMGVMEDRDVWRLNLELLLRKPHGKAGNEETKRRRRSKPLKSGDGAWESTFQLKAGLHFYYSYLAVVLYATITMVSAFYYAFHLWNTRSLQYIHFA